MDNSFIRNVAVMAGGITGDHGPEPTQYIDRQYQWYGHESEALDEMMAKYASNYVQAQVQGTDPNDFYKFVTCYVRMANATHAVANSPTIAEDYKRLLFDAKTIAYFPLGAKLIALGSTWLCVNADNLTSVAASGMVRRCNSVWNYLDYYGNVCSEPIAVESHLALASTPSPQNDVIIQTRGNYNVRLQYNDATRQLGINSRIILGSAAFYITGYTDFVQEFTGDYSSVHLLEFTARYEEPNLEIDDMENHVAGGKTFSWEIFITGNEGMYTGTTQTMTAQSERCGEAVSSTTAYPVSYIWSSSDDSVATVDQNGLVTAVSEGSCKIYCKLAQNENYSASFSLSVTDGVAGKTAAFKTTPPTAMQMYDAVTLSAAAYENGAQTADVCDWKFSFDSGASYAAIANGNECLIQCWGGSTEPLTVTADFGNGVSVSCVIALEGI